MAIQDHFSTLAAVYVRHRPRYPEALFTYLAGLCAERKLVWDCGTGNGQAAIALAEHFERVVATDASPQQIAHAPSHDRVTYSVEPAEAVSLEPKTVDLVTVAVAVHWFDHARFYAEVRRVLKPGGVIAVWTYHLPAINPAIDRVLQTYYAGVLWAYWPPEIMLLHDRYRTLPFPFLELDPPSFSMPLEWDLGELAGFLSSWSAVRPYQSAHGMHPLETVWDDLSQAWGPADGKRQVVFPLHIRVGRVAP
jgi:SAM-dependent methyltransferase